MPFKSIRDGKCGVLKPAVSNVAFGDDEGTLHVLDAATGRTIWTFDTGDQIISSPNQHAGRIVVGSYDGLVYCLDARRGKLIWKYETQGRVHPLLRFRPT